MTSTCYFTIIIYFILLRRDLMLNNNYLRALPYELGKLFQLQVSIWFLVGLTIDITYLLTWFFFWGGGKRDRSYIDIIAATKDLILEMLIINLLEHGVEGKSSWLRYTLTFLWGNDSYRNKMMLVDCYEF